MLRLPRLVRRCKWLSAFVRGWSRHATRGGEPKNWVVACGRDVGRGVGRGLACLGGQREKRHAMISCGCWAFACQMRVGAAARGRAHERPAELLGRRRRRARDHSNSKASVEPLGASTTGVFSSAHPLAGWAASAALSRVVRAHALKERCRRPDVWQTAGPPAEGECHADEMTHRGGDTGATDA